MIGTQEYWSAECPHCGEYHFVKFDNIHFEHEVRVVGGKKQFDIKKINFCCPNCGCLSSEKEIKKAPHKWIAQNPDAYKNGIRSFWINAFSSPWMDWYKIVLRFLEADGDPEKLKTVFNTLLGELFEDRGELLTEDQMMNNREYYKAELPDGVLCLTCGVDTQDNRLEYEVVGHGYFGEEWGIEKGIILGKPDEEDKPELESVWSRLDRVIEKEWTYENGKKLKISLTFVDSGGHYTQEVYEQCAKRIGKRVFAVKGKGGEGIPYISPPSKVKIVKEDAKGRKVVTGKAYLYIIGVDSGKEKIMSSLKVQEPGARYYHFPKQEEKGYDSNYFRGLLSEKMTYKNRKWQWEKLPGHERNEPLDMRNYANAAFQILNPNLEHIEKMLKTPNKEIEIIKKKQKKQIKKQKKNQLRNDDW